MSVQVKNITKRYGPQLAVDNVSFEVGQGEIVGFIGPNGAGKTTTMKIITGTLPADQGDVLIGNIPVLGFNKKIRKAIGYLPEHNPLYPEMYIREYLQYVAGLYELKGERGKGKVKEVIDLTGLGPEVHKKIGALSKGYRQRVGLAQSLIHDPEILILDEPTSGLDPNQLVEIRSLISRVGEKKTVLLSTHILQEVEAICDRVIVIDHGKIMADGQAEELKTRSTGFTQTIHIETSEAAEPELWKQLDFVKNIRVIKSTQFLLETDEQRDIRGEVFNFAVNQGLTILSLSLQKKSLETVFREITSQ